MGLVMHWGVLQNSSGRGTADTVQRQIPHQHCQAAPIDLLSRMELLTLPGRDSVPFSALQGSSGSRPPAALYRFSELSAHASSKMQTSMLTRSRAMVSQITASRALSTQIAGYRCPSYAAV